MPAIVRNMPRSITPFLFNDLAPDFGPRWATGRLDLKHHACRLIRRVCDRDSHAPSERTARKGPLRYYGVYSKSRRKPP